MIKPIGRRSRAAMTLQLLGAPLLVACSTPAPIDGAADFHSAATAKPMASLDVPPDLSRLPQDGRYATLPGGAVRASSSSDAGTAPTAGASQASSGASVAPQSLGSLTLHREGSSRWLSSTELPEALWPRLRSFLVDQGFTIKVEDRAAGVLETEWATNRAKIPQDFIRRTIGRLFENAYDSGERDRFRVRVERTAQGSDVFLSHAGTIEDWADASHTRMVLKARPPEPELEATMLARLMSALGGDGAGAKTASTQPTASSSEPVHWDADAARIDVKDSLDRTWRRVQLGIDRQGWAVMARDRQAGTVTLSPSEQSEEPGFFDKLLGRGGMDATKRPTITLKVEAGDAQTTTVRLSAPPQDDWSRKALERLSGSMR